MNFPLIEGKTGDILNSSDVKKAIGKICEIDTEVGYAIEHYLNNVLWVLGFFEGVDSMSLTNGDDLEKERMLYRQSIYKILVGMSPGNVVKMIRSNLAHTTDYSSNPDFKITSKMLENFFSNFIDRTLVMEKNKN